MTGLLVLLAVAGGLTATSFLLELGTRFLIRTRRHYYVWRPGMRLHLHLDRMALPELEPWVRFEVNRDGERGDPPPRRRDGRTLRILVAGGSVAEGYLLDQTSSWPHALQSILEEPPHRGALGVTRVHVGNIARSGVGSALLDRILEHVLPRYRDLDVILVMVGGSDIIKWLEKGAPVVLEESPFDPALVFDEHPQTSFAWSPRRLALAELTRRVLTRFMRPIEKRQGAGKRLAEARAMRARATEIRTNVADPKAMLDRFEYFLRTLLKRAQRAAPRVIVIRQPWFEKSHSPEELAHLWSFGTGNPYFTQVSVYYSFDVAARLMRLLDSRAVKVAEELRIEHVDLKPVLEPSLTNYYDFIHLTRAGAAVVASEVARIILGREGWLTGQRRGTNPAAEPRKH